MLESDEEPDHAVGDAGVATRAWRQPSVRGGGGGRTSDLASPRLFEMSTSRSASSRAKASGLASAVGRASVKVTPPACGHLAGGARLVLGGRLERVRHPGDARVALASRSARALRRRALAVHLAAAGSQPLQQHPGVERADIDGPGVPHQGLDLVLGCSSPTPGWRRQDLALTVDVLGRGVDHDVRAEVHGPLQKRGREHVVAPPARPASWASRHTAATSISSCIGLDGDSKNTAWVGWRARRATGRGRGRRTVGIPQLGRSSSRMTKHDPNSAREATTRSPCREER